jgi:hypothetical protein
MKTVSKTLYDKAITFLQNQARPLERALYEYHFRGGDTEPVLNELAKFQNADGGFGHGLEPDLRLRDSSVIATSVAFQHLRELGVPADHPMIAAGSRYLLNTYDPQALNWPIIPPNVDDAPHAPWWVYDGDLQKSKSNPRAEIAGYVNDYARHFPDAMRTSLSQSVIDHLLQHPDKMEMHDLLCYIRFYETEALPDSTKATVLDKLKRIVEHTVERDPAQWANYGLPPLSVIDSPESPFADLFRDVIPLNLDFIIDSQSEDGTWRPNWSWGDQWPDAWEEARRDWTGYITLHNLRKLRTFGRID